MLKEVLAAYLKNPEWIEVYSKIDDTSSFVVGKVLSLDDDYVLLGLVHPTGVYDGYIVLSLGKLYQVKEKSKYISRLLMLMEHKNKFSFLPSLMGKHEVLQVFMHQAQQAKWVVSIELNNSGYNDIIGIIQSVNDTTLEVTEITDNGYIDGKTTVECTYITRISADDVNERQLQLLASLVSE